MLPPPRTTPRRARRTALALASALLVAIAASCGGDGALSPAELDLTLTFSAPTRTVRVGQVVELRKLLVDTRDVPPDAAAMTWSSSAPTVAQVTQAGGVAGVAPGEAEVRVTDGRRSATIRVVVTLVPVAGVSFAAVEGDLFIGDELTLHAVPLDSAGNELGGREVSYSSSDSAVVRVGAEGTLVALAEGSTTLTAASGGMYSSQRVRVVPRTVAIVEVVPEALRMRMGDTVRLAVTIRDSRGDAMDPRPIGFRTMDPTTAVVDGEGLVRATGPGNTGIIVEVDERPAVVTVDVEWPESPAPPPPASAQPPRPVPAPPAVDAGDGGFSITVRFVGEGDARAAVFVDQAVARWSAAIVGDVPDIDLELPADACFEGQPAINETVDDLLVLVRVLDIDGPGRALARAGPCLIRTASGIPLMGVVELDRADLDLDARTVLDVVTHEIGHVLGVGTLWSYRRLVHGPGGDDPIYQGAAAMAAYGEMGGSEFVPLENTGGPGTRDVHWRETTFRAELMTGFINGGVNALSRLTIGALRDLGYLVDVRAAEPYALPARGAASARLVAPGGTPVTDEVLQPRFAVDADGVLRRLP